MNPTTKKIVLVVIAIIAVALFVHYMMYPSLSEAFQEGAVPDKTVTNPAGLNKIAKDFSAAISNKIRVETKVNGKKAMVAVHTKITQDIQDMTDDTLNKIVINGNLQNIAPKISTEYTTFIDKVKGYIPKNSPRDLAAAIGFSNARLQIEAIKRRVPPSKPIVPPSKPIVPPSNTTGTKTTGTSTSTKK